MLVFDGGVEEMATEGKVVWNGLFGVVGVVAGVMKVLKNKQDVLPERSSLLFLQIPFH